MPSHEAVIGLEVHAQLATASKMFCSCANKFGAEPNTQVCEICAGMPGALPRANKKAVEYAARMGLALHCVVNQFSIFSRKNYFYPDLPAGFQTSQLDPPICEHGHLDIRVNGVARRIGITRIHMEDDAGKNIHEEGGHSSYVDLNRAGAPLIEIVSEPDLRSAEEAVAYLRALRSILLYLGICNGNMEEGSLRCDANVSIRPFGSAALGVRAEIKNLNSFRNVQRAIDFEIARQEDCLADGVPVAQETRLYDSVKNCTVAMRGKEDAHDYRYFPNPDLPPVRISDDELASWKASLPELPHARKLRFSAGYGLSEADAEQLTGEKDLADFFEEALAIHNNPKRLATLIQGLLLREINATGVSASGCAMRPPQLAELARIVDEGLISLKIAQDIFSRLFQSGASPEQFVREQGYIQVSDVDALEAVARRVVQDNPREAADYRAGKTKLMGFFIGRVMRETDGKANPALVNDLVSRLLR